MYIYTYNTGSASAKALKENLGAKIIKNQNSAFKGSEGKTVINWGNSKMNQEVLKCKILNHPEAVSLATNKLKFFDHVKNECQVPDYTEDYTVAESWVNEGHTVFARSKLEGQGGDGIMSVQNIVDLEMAKANAKIYVKYIPKKDEYRIHVMGGEVIDMQRKALNPAYQAKQANWQIRNHNNGFIFAREGVDPPKQVIEQAVKAVELCGLDFGAVDVIWNSFRKKAYVLEVNTAPGLEGQTVKSYIEGLDKLFQQIGFGSKLGGANFDKVHFQKVLWDGAGLAVEEGPVYMDVDLDDEVDEEFVDDDF